MDIGDELILMEPPMRGNIEKRASNCSTLRLKYFQIART